MTAAKPHPSDERTPLEERLLQLIEDHGPIQVGDFMADALGHPQHGYYTTSLPFGKEGDFTTAPEISQIFGELIGAWLIQSWKDIGSPSMVNLIELGPGRAVLMEDILRTAAKVAPKFLKAVHVYMVETSGRLRYEQTKRMQGAKVPVTWATEMHDIPLAPTLIVANEFFDCLPIRQFVRTSSRDDKCWRERLIGSSGIGASQRLCFELSHQTYVDPEGAPNGAVPEDVFETCKAAQDIMTEITTRFEHNKGRALIIDYGHGRSSFGDTVQAVRQHQFWPPLELPGKADVTAHVDFAALSRTGRNAGALVHGPILQGQFLATLGLEQRALALGKAAKDDAQRKVILTGARRLAHPDEMGTLFKVLCVQSQGIDAPVGF